MVVKYIQELRGKESDSIFFYADEALKIVASTMDSACWVVHMKMVIKLRRVYGLVSKT